MEMIKKHDRAILLSSQLLTPQLFEAAGSSLTEADIDFLKSIGAVRHYRKGEYIFSAGDIVKHLVFVLKGMVQILEIGIEGLEKTFLYVNQGCFIGAAAFYHQQPIIFHIRVKKDVEVLFIDEQHSNELLSRVNITLFLLRSEAITSRVMAMQIEDSIFRTSQQTICRILLCLNLKANEDCKLNFTHQEIASMAGVHRVTVSNTIAMLKEEGIIDLDAKKRIVLIDPEKLKWKLQYCGFGYG